MERNELEDFNILRYVVHYLYIISISTFLLHRLHRDPNIAISESTRKSKTRGRYLDRWSGTFGTRQRDRCQVTSIPCSSSLYQTAIMALMIRHKFTRWPKVSLNHRRSPSLNDFTNSAWSLAKNTVPGIRARIEVINGVGPCCQVQKCLICCRTAFVAWKESHLNY